MARPMVWQRRVRQGLNLASVKVDSFSIASAAFGETYTRIRFRVGLVADPTFPFGSNGSVVAIGINLAESVSTPIPAPWSDPNGTDWVWWETIPFAPERALFDSSGNATFTYGANVPAGDVERDVRAQRKSLDPGSILRVTMEIDDVTTNQNSFWSNWSSSTGILEAP